MREQEEQPDTPLVAYISYDEKPGAVGKTAPDLPPVPGRYSTHARDYEYKRHGTVTLMAGLDLVTGHVHSAVVDRHRSREFVAFLRQLDASYPPATKLRVVLDNRHTSKETRAFTLPNRFEFVFSHGSWLNLVESFFSKVARTLLRGIRVDSKEELVERIQRYINQLNEQPVVFKWTYKMDEVPEV